jgi:hypothetical protein
MSVRTLATTALKTVPTVHFYSVNTKRLAEWSALTLTESTWKDRQLSQYRRLRGRRRGASPRRATYGRPVPMKKGTTRYVGLDVHKATVTVALADDALKRSSRWLVNSPDSFGRSASGWRSRRRRWRDLQK